MLRDENVPGINSSQHGDLDKFYGSRRASMSLPDKLLLDPLDKFEQHSKVWFLSRSVPLEDGNSYYSNMSDNCARYPADHWCGRLQTQFRNNVELFIPHTCNICITQDGDYEGLDPSKSLYLYNADSVSSFVNTSVGNYYGINDLTLESFSLPTNEDGSVRSPEVRVTPLSFRDYVSDNLKSSNKSWSSVSVRITFIPLIRPPLLRNSWARFPPSLFLTVSRPDWNLTQLRTTTVLNGIFSRNCPLCPEDS